MGEISPYWCELKNKYVEQMECAYQRNSGHAFHDVKLSNMNINTDVHVNQFEEFKISDNMSFE